MLFSVENGSAKTDAKVDTKKALKSLLVSLFGGLLSIAIAEWLKASLGNTEFGEFVIYPGIILLVAIIFLVPIFVIVRNVKVSLVVLLVFLIGIILGSMVTNYSSCPVRSIIRKSVSEADELFKAERYKEALEIYQSIDMITFRRMDETRYAEVNYNMGMCCYNLFLEEKDVGEQLSYLYESIRVLGIALGTYDNKDNPAVCGNILFLIGREYLEISYISDSDIEALGEAQKNFHEALDIYRIYLYRFEYAKVLTYLGRVHWLFGNYDPDEYKFTTAILYLEIAKTIYENDNIVTNEDYVMSRIYLGDALLALYDFKLTNHIDNRNVYLSNAIGEYEETIKSKEDMLSDYDIQWTHKNLGISYYKSFWITNERKDLDNSKRVLTVSLDTNTQLNRIYADDCDEVLRYLGKVYYYGYPKVDNTTDQNEYYRIALSYFEQIQNKIDSDEEVIKEIHAKMTESEKNGTAPLWFQGIKSPPNSTLNLPPTFQRYRFKVVSAPPVLDFMPLSISATQPPAVSGR